MGLEILGPTGGVERRLARVRPHVSLSCGKSCPQKERREVQGLFTISRLTGEVAKASLKTNATQP